MNSETRNILIFLTAFFVIFVIAMMIRRKSETCTMKGKYDERQKVIQGIGYKYGFLTMAVAGMAYALLSTAWEIPVTTTVGVTACVFLGIMVYVVYCIWKDAYFGLTNQRSQFIILISIVTIVNMATSIVSICNGEIVRNGVVGDKALSLICAILFLVILVALVIKAFQERTLED